jgi:hypothetical protein
LNSRLLLIRGERKTGMIAEEFLPASKKALLGQTIKFFLSLPPASSFSFLTDI